MIFDWCVIGAGPAGIAAVGKLIDSGVKPSNIAWIDPAFRVGDFGTLWRNVPSNTKVETFLKFLHSCAAFNYKKCSQDFILNHTDPNATCDLGKVADPLQWITEELKNKVHPIQDIAEKLSLQHRVWNIKLSKEEIQSKNVILAIGADAKNLAYPTPTIIPLHDALDNHKIKQHVTSNDTVAVFGSSHSSVLVLRSLVESGVKQIINFYRSPFVFAVYFEDWILFDDTGLKGSAADWARENLIGELPSNLQRIYSNEQNVSHYLPQCDKVIYAIGFERRTLPVVEELGQMQYMEHSGIIAPGLFGLGIAFPEAKYDRLGTLEYRVGLAKFMDYLQRIMPIWLRYTP